MLFRRRIARATLALAALFVACVVLLVASPRGRCALRIAPDFVPYGPDARVYYEPGSEDAAARFAAALPDAVTRVEKSLSLPFKSAFRVYVCRSGESFARHVGLPQQTPVRGTAFTRDIWVSPTAFAFHGRDTTVETLAHELAHLHFDQHLGWFRRYRLMPAWFGEGLADWVAGTGYEIVSRETAGTEFRIGNYFAPDSSGRLPVPKGPGGYGLPAPVLHAQSRMFVEYLHAGHETSFKPFVAAVLGGRRFDLAFEDCFGRSLEEEWQAFVATFGGEASEPDRTPSDVAHD